jgi:hypothetical protein
MQHGFIRVFFGDPWEKTYGAGGELMFDILFLKTNKIEEENKTQMMVFGTENFSRLTDLGFSCVLVDKKSILLPNEEWWIHKFLAYEVASDLFEEFIHLDIDCHQLAPLPDNFWGVYLSKDCIQAAIMAYKRAVVPWRGRKNRTIIPCGGFTYLRGKDIVKKLMIKKEHMAREKAPMSDETVIAAITDEMTGGWKGVEEYVKRFEPTFFHMGGPYNPPVEEPKLFDHFLRQGRIISGLKRAGVFYDGMTAKEALDIALKMDFVRKE